MIVLGRLQHIADRQTAIPRVVSGKMRSSSTQQTDSDQRATKTDGNSKSHAGHKEDS